LTLVLFANGTPDFGVNSVKQKVAVKHGRILALNMSHTAGRQALSVSSSKKEPYCSLRPA